MMIPDKDQNKRMITDQIRSRWIKGPGRQVWDFTYFGKLFLKDYFYD